MAQQEDFPKIHQVFITEYANAPDLQDRTFVIGEPYVMLFDPKILAPEDQEEALADFKEKLEEAFEVIADGKVEALFDYQLKED